MEAVAHLAEMTVAVPTDEFTLLVREHRSRAFYFALQMVGNREDAMDITQEAFLRLHRHWHRRDPERPFAPWMYAIVRNLAIDFLRKRKSRRETDLDAAANHPAGAGPEVLAEQSEVKAAVWKAINQLPPAQREVVILRELHGLSYAEIAEVTGEPVTAINSRLHDAREKLRSKLERYL